MENNQNYEEFYKKRINAYKITLCISLTIGIIILLIRIATTSNNPMMALSINLTIESVINIVNYIPLIISAYSFTKIEKLKENYLLLKEIKKEQNKDE